MTQVAHGSLFKEPPDTLPRVEQFARGPVFTAPQSSGPNQHTTMKILNCTLILTATLAFTAEASAQRNFAKEADRAFDNEQ